jgi:hypothetical protein
MQRASNAMASPAARFAQRTHYDKCRKPHPSRRASKDGRAVRGLTVEKKIVDLSQPASTAILMACMVLSPALYSFTQLLLLRFALAGWGNRAE